MLLDDKKQKKKKNVDQSSDFKSSLKYNRRKNGTYWDSAMNIEVIVQLVEALFC